MIVLSDEFYREITSHPIPTDLEAVKRWLGRLRHSIFLCGCLTGVSSERAMRAFRYSDASAWPHKLARANTQDRGINADGQSLRIQGAIAVLPPQPA